jgi:hypothetical protein
MYDRLEPVFLTIHSYGFKFHETVFLFDESMLDRRISVLNKSLPVWALILLMIGSAAAAAATALAAPQAEVSVAVSQTIVIDESAEATKWLGDPYTKFDVAEWKGVGQGQYAKIIIMGQGNDYGWFKLTLKNLAGDTNIIKVYAVNVPPELKVKFSSDYNTYTLFDTYYAKIDGNGDKVIYMYVLIKPGTPQTTLEFEVRVEVLGC